MMHCYKGQIQLVMTQLNTGLNSYLIKLSENIKPYITEWARVTSFNLTKSRSKVIEHDPNSTGVLFSYAASWPCHKVVTMVTAYLFTLITDTHRMDDHEKALFCAQPCPITLYFHKNFKAPCQLMWTLFEHGHHLSFFFFFFFFALSILIFFSEIKILESEVVFDILKNRQSGFKYW